MHERRVVGDHLYKTNGAFPNTEQVITAMPDVRTIDTKLENGDFIVLACDGIWNSIDSQGAVDFISNRIRTRPDVRLSLICEEVCDFISLYVLITAKYLPSILRDCLTITT